MNGRFHHVGVLKGGPSAEREVSLKSGKAVARGLREAGYQVEEIDIVQDAITLPKAVEAVFVALHGTFGEDGTAQDLLEKMGIPYTGSGPEASRKAFDKIKSKKFFDEHGIPTASWEVIRREQRPSMAPPLVLKPPCQGSSIGIEIVKNEKVLDEALERAFRFDDVLLVEQYVDGKELTASVLDGEILPWVEVIAPDGNYDFESKYTSGVCEYRVPAALSGAPGREGSRLALDSYRAMKCRGLSRIDFRMTNDGSWYILEVNTLPGFTETSLFPKAAQAAGISFPNLCHRIMDLAICDSCGGW